jgi:asparagine synthetase B (glutamine-hydrolysing)
VSNERFALRSLYWRQLGATIVCASEIKAVLAAGGAADLDRIGVGELMTFGHPTETRTLFQGVHALPPGSRLIYERGTVRIERYWEFELHEQPARAAEKHLRVELVYRLRQACARQTVGPGRVGICLAGDLESRVLLTALQTTEEPLACGVTFEGASREAANCARLAARWGLRHLLLHPSPGALAMVAPEAVWRTEGAHSLEGASSLEFHHRLRPELDVLLWSAVPSPWRDPAALASWQGSRLHAGGSTGVPWGDDLKALFSKRLRRELCEPSQNYEGHPFDGASSLTRGPGDTQLEHQLRWELPSMWRQAAQLALNDFEIRAPLLDHDLVDFAARLPYRQRAGQRLLRSLLMGRRMTGMAAAVRGTIPPRAGAGEASNWRSSRQLLALIPGGMSRGGRGFRAADPGSELRSDAAFHQDLLLPFLRSDHFPDAILDRDTALRMLAAHREGSRDYTAVLSGLATLALVQRQFLVPGLQAPAAPRSYPEPAPALEAA